MAVRLKMKAMESYGMTILQQLNSVTRSTAPSSCLLVQDITMGRINCTAEQQTTTNNNKNNNKTKSGRYGGVTQYIINPSRYPAHKLRHCISDDFSVERKSKSVKCASGSLPFQLPLSPSSSSSSSISLGQRVHTLELPLSVMLGTNQRPSFLSETQCSFSSSSSSSLLPDPLVPPQSQPPPQHDKPTPAQMAFILLKLREEMPAFFAGDYSRQLYAADMVFENSLANKPWTVQGLTAYIALLTSWRMAVKTCFSQPQLDLLKISKNVEEGKIEARWRVRGRPRTPWKTTEKVIVEAFSTFLVTADGTIGVHKVDKVMPGGKEPNRVMSWLARVGVSLIPSPPQPSVGVTRTSQHIILPDH